MKDSDPFLLIRLLYCISFFHRCCLSVLTSFCLFLTACSYIPAKAIVSWSVFSVLSRFIVGLQPPFSPSLFLSFHSAQAATAVTYSTAPVRLRGNSWKLAQVKCALIQTIRNERTAEPIPLAVPRSAFLDRPLPSGTFVSQFV